MKILLPKIFFLLLFASFGFNAFAAAPGCATGLVPLNGGTIANPSTPFTWNAPAGGATGYKVYIGTDGGGSTTPTNIVNGSSVTVTTYTYTGALSCGTTYYWQIIPYNNPGAVPATGCAIQSFSITAAGTPSVFPVGSWNAYCYSDVTYTTYTGFYTSAGQNFDSRISWNQNNSPSSVSPNGAATYQGCSVPNDNHSVIYKRQGFTPGTYSIDVLNDDGCVLYLNGNLIYTRASWTPSVITNVWTGNLDATSQIEFRWNDTGSGSYGAVTFNPMPTPVIVAGSIAGDQILCAGNDPLAFTSTTAGSGTCGSLVYQWQQDVGCTGTWSNIPGANAVTYNVPAGITQTTCYRRNVEDPNCARLASSNTVTVTITSVQQGNPSVFPVNTWNAYVYDFSVTGYTATDDNWTDYKGFFNFNGLSASNPGFNTYYLYSVVNVPSSGPGYAGCQVGATLSGAQIKRQGFPTGIYQIDFNSDDAGYLYINGTLVYGRTGCCTLVPNVWTGPLDATSTIDYRYKNNGGSGYGVLILTAVTPAPLTGGTVNSSASSIICTGDTPPPFTSASLASGGCTLTGGYQWQADTGSGFADIPGATSTTYAPTNVTVTTSYRRRISDVCGTTAYSNVLTLTVGTPTPPNPAVFGSNVWNAYVYNNITWTQLYGSYVDNGVSASDPSFYSGSVWNIYSRPSLAPGYQGCQVGIDNHGVIYKRQGFPTGTYQLDFDSDDAGYVYVNGVLVYSRTSCCAIVSNVWTGNLDASSTIEFKWMDTGSGSYGRLTFTPVTPTIPLDPGVITNNNSSIICSGNSLPPLVSSTNATSSCYIYYQWEKDTGSGFASIPGATGATYTPSNITVNTSFRRKATDACGASAYSNVIALTIGTFTSVTPTFGSNTWNAYVYDFGAGNPTGNGAYTANNTGWNNNSGTFQYGGISSSNPGFNTAASGTFLYNLTEPPSYAPGYQGCQVGNTQNGVIFKRQGFPTGTYQLDFTSDDPGYLYVNGALVSSRTTNGTNTNAWTGSLTSSSTVELRYKNNGGNGNAILTFIPTTSTIPLTPGAIAGTQTVCQAASVTAFTSSTPANSGCTIFYQWQNSTSSATGPWTDISTATNATYASGALSQTTYFRRVVTDGCGGNDVSNVITVTVNPLPLAAGSVSGPATFCPNQAGVAYSIPAVTYANGYNWSLPSGATIATGTGTNSITVNFTTNNGTVSVTPTNACGNGTAASQAVTMTPVPSAAAAFTVSSATACVGQAGVVYTIPVSANATSYSWTVPSDATITSVTNTNSITVTFGSASGSVSVVPSNTCGTGASRSIAVTVNTIPGAAGTISGLSNICRPATTSSSAYQIPAVTGATSYTWTLPSGTTIGTGAGTRSITATFTNTSVTGDFTVTPVNACGTGTPSTLNVIVSTTTPSAAGTVTGTASACAGTIGLVYNVTAVSNATNYAWTTPTGTTITSGSTTNSMTATLGSTSGNITVRGVNACGNGTISPNFALTVNPYPGTAGVITGSTTVCAGLSGVTYSIAAVTNANGYTWTLPSGASITGGANTRSITVTMGSTSGTVSVTPTNACGNGTGNSVAVTVNDVPPAAGTITGAGTVCTLINNTYSIAAVPTATGYTWSVPFGATITGSGTSVTAKFLITNGNISVTPTNACGSGPSSSLPVAITLTAPLAAGTITGASPVCAGSTSNYSIAAVTGATNYTWTVPSGSTINSGAGTISISNTFGTASGNVQVTPSNVCGNGILASKIVVVNNLPSTPSATGGSRCGTGPVTLTASGSSGTYAWYTVPSGGSVITTGTSYAPIVATTTTFYVAGTSGSCESASRFAVDATVNSCLTTWIGVTSTAWTTASNWSTGVVPTSIDPVVIPAASGVPFSPVVSTAVNTAALTINTNGSVTLASTGTLNAYGNVLNNGALTTAAGSTLSLNGSSAQTINGVSSVNNLRINNAAGVSALSNLTLKGALYLPQGAFSVNNNVQIDVDNGGNIAYNSGDAGSVNGTITIFRNVAAAKTHYISCPLENVTVNDLADDAQVINPATNKTRLFNSDFAGQGWTAINSLSTVFVPSIAYSMWFPALTQVDFTGNYTHGATYTTPSYPNTSLKYIFVGNPYPTTLDWNNAAGWTKTNIADAIYFWNPVTTGYASYVNGVGINGGTQYVPVMNSFFVATTASGGSSSLAINNQARQANQSSALWRTAADQTIRISLNGEVYSDETVIRFNENATSAFDSNFDAYKMFNFATTPSIYTTSESIQYGINSLSDAASYPTIPVSVKLPSDGTYTLRIANSDPDLIYMLIDKKLGTETPVTGTDYVFTGSKTDPTDRFELNLLTGITTGIQSATEADAVQITSSGERFIIRTSTCTGQNCAIEILDIAGKKLKTFTNVVLQNGVTYLDSSDIAAGTYLVKVMVGNSVFVQQATIIR